jgi:hypothetical protein
VVSDQLQGLPFPPLNLHTNRVRYTEGAEDGIEILADATDIMKLPFGLGEAAVARSRAIPQVRAIDTRVTENGGAEESFVLPILIPKTPQRYYFKFGKPVRFPLLNSFHTLIISLGLNSLRGKNISIHTMFLFNRCGHA